MSRSHSSPGAAGGGETAGEAVELLRDAQGRPITYLRLSVTDRCNFRCWYCSPALWGARSELLTAEELARVARVFAGLGVRKVRLTGGEPLLRPDIVQIASEVARTPGLRTLALSTNAARLADLARPLREAGVYQLNISLDTLREETFRSISAQGTVAEVLAGIDAAASAGFERIRLNTVVMEEVNSTEAPELIRFAHDRGLVPRFIELMPFSPRGRPVPTRVLLERLDAAGVPLLPEPPRADDGTAGPARYYRAPTGPVGFVSAMTEGFCASCNRVRVSASGELRACLGGRAQVPLAGLLRGGASDGALARAVREALERKPEGHRFGEGGQELASMMATGG